MKRELKRGYTLIELIVAIGLFAIVMTLVAGAYIMMIDLTHQSQSAAIGIDNLSFALEAMTRTIRTGTNYACDGSGDCSGGSSLSVVGADGQTYTYSLSSGAIVQTENGVPAPLTDSSIVDITRMDFYVSGTTSGDAYQPYVTIVLSGKTLASSQSTSFTVETGATMREIDL